MQRKSVFHSTAIISVCTAMSRGLGLIREILMANFFGTTLAKSAFDVAFKVPNLFRRLFGEGALSAAFIPVFSESLQKEGVEEAGRLANRIMTMLLLTLLLIAVGGVLVISACLHWFILGEKAAAVLP
jgi:putative peptidoglycan lipid II flippase